MKLLTYKSGLVEYTYYLGENGNEVFHGEYKDYHSNGRLWEHSFYYHGLWHGERKCYGKQTLHCFYINGDYHPYVEMNEQEKLLFQIQHPGFRFIEG